MTNNLISSAANIHSHSEINFKGLRHWVAEMLRLENQSLWWQELSSSGFYFLLKLKNPEKYIIKQNQHQSPRFLLSKLAIQYPFNLYNKTFEPIARNVSYLFIKSQCTFSFQRSNN